MDKRIFHKKRTELIKRISRRYSHLIGNNVTNNISEFYSSAKLAFAADVINEGNEFQPYLYTSNRLFIASIKEKLAEGDIEGKLNILVLGSAGVGKTSLIYRYLFDFFKPSYIISEDVKKFNHNVHTLVGTAADVVLWDIPGQINPELLRERFKDKINGIICIFDQEETHRLWMIQKAICGCENTRQSACASLIL